MSRKKGQWVCRWCLKVNEKSVYKCKVCRKNKHETI